MSTPLTDALNALILYSNGVTGASDTTISDCIQTLVAGYNGGSSGTLITTPIQGKPLTTAVTSLITYANSVTGASDQTLSECIATLASGYGGKSWTDYVQDGLEILWDGIQNTRNGHVQNPSKWENLAGSSYDMANGNVTFEDDCAVFNGSNTYFKTNYTENQYPTIEIVLLTPQNSSGLIVKTGRTNNTKGFAVVSVAGGTTYRFIGRRGSTNGGYKDVGIDFNVKKSFSALWNGTGTTIDIYKNGVITSGNYGTNNWSYGNFAIGAYDRYNPPTQYYYTGKIYCIRMYTRTLTEAEVLQNYAVDKARFGLSDE